MKHTLLPSDIEKEQKPAPSYETQQSPICRSTYIYPLSIRFTHSLAALPQHGFQRTLEDPQVRCQLWDHRPLTHLRLRSQYRKGTALGYPHQSNRRNTSPHQLCTDHPRQLRRQYGTPTYGRSLEMWSHEPLLRHRVSKTFWDSAYRSGI